MISKVKSHGNDTDIKNGSFLASPINSGKLSILSYISVSMAIMGAYIVLSVMWLSTGWLWSLNNTPYIWYSRHCQKEGRRGGELTIIISMHTRFLWSSPVPRWTSSGKKSPSLTDPSKKFKAATRRSNAAYRTSLNIWCEIISKSACCIWITNSLELKSGDIQSLTCKLKRTRISRHSILGLYKMLPVTTFHSSDCIFRIVALYCPQWWEWVRA